MPRLKHSLFSDRRENDHICREILNYSNHHLTRHFAAGHDLHISGNAIINYDNYTFLDYSYQCRTGQNAKTFLADEKHFTVTDYKVFGLHKNKPSIPSHVRDHKMSNMSSEL